jgi:O-antigen ligase/tetratricopeptide (TPR) repeat protein
MSNLEYYLKTTLRYCLYVALFTPLIYTSFTLFPFIFGKTLFFRAVIEISFAVFLALILFFPKYFPRRSLVIKAVLVYIAIVFLAMIFSVDVSRSFWSNHERMMGVWTLLHAIAFFVMASSVFETKKDWINFFGVSVFVSMVVGILGIYQYFFGFLHAAPTDRVYSTLGNSIYFGGYMLFHSLISALCFFESKNKKDAFNLFWLASFILGLVSVYLSGTRGVFLAFCASAVFILVAFALLHSSKKIKVICAAILILLGISGGVIWTNKSFFKKSYLISNLLDISVSAMTGQTRLINWQTAFEAWKQRPLLGWGPDNYYIAFNANYPPKIMEFGAYETWQDHAHNVIFDTLNQSGILGMITYLLIFASAVYLVWKNIKSKKMSETSGVLIIAAIVAYFIQNLFVFDTLTLLMLFYLSLGFIHTMSAEERKNEERKLLSGLSDTQKYSLLGLIFVVCAIFIYATDITQIRGSKMTIDALKGAQYSVVDSLKLFEKTMMLQSPYLQETRNEYAKLIGMIGSLSDEQKESLCLKAIEALKINAENHPMDVYQWNYLAQWYMILAQMQEGGSREFYFNEAKVAIDKALELSPKRQQIYFTLARYWLVRQNYNEAVRVLEESKSFAPGARDVRWFLGICYVYAGNLEKAYPELEFARKTGIPLSNKAETMMVLPAYVLKQDEAGVDWLLKTVSNMNPGPFEYANFSNAYKKIGNLTKAEEMRGQALSFGEQYAAQVNEIINQE